jgi:hypothetical protein
MESDWNDERIEYLEELWVKQGLAGQICALRLNARFRTSFTRNAIISKVHRLPWPKRRERDASCRDTPRNPRRPAQRARSPFFKDHVFKTPPTEQHERQQSEYRVQRKAKQKTLIATVLAKPELLAPPTDAVRLSCSDLPADQCRWIHGDPRHKDGPLYCSNKRFVDQTGKRWIYCAHHCTHAYPVMQEAMAEVEVPQKEHAHV